MNLNANANTNAMQLHTGADANIKRTHCGCRCRRKRSNCNANANTDANPISGIDKRGRQTKLCDMDSGTNHHLMQWKTCNCKNLKMINAVAKKNMRHGPGELSARRRGNRSLGDGGTALSTARKRYLFFTVRTPQASLVGEKCYVGQFLLRTCLFLNDDTPN